MNDQLIDQYLRHEQAYWNEIIEQLSGNLSSKASLFPDFYFEAGNLLIFSAKDGLVSATFDKNFRFREEKFNTWLQEPSKLAGPFASIVQTGKSHEFSITQWAQVLSGNGIKIIVDGNVPNNITIRGNFPSIPSIMVHDPETNEKNPITLFNIETDDLLNFGLNLRNVEVTEVDTGKTIYPFLWRQLDIYGEKALVNLSKGDAKLKASRELNSVLGGINLGLNKNHLKSEPVLPVIHAMDQLIIEFEKLLDEEGDREQSLQSFLQNNPILLAPDYLECIPQGKFGAEYKNDFIIVQPSDSGGKCTLVEIEHAGHPLFKKDGGTRAELTHTIDQVRDWRNWLRKHGSYAQDSLGLKNIHADCPAKIIIGRRSSLNEETAENLESINSNFHHQTIILTYDDVLDQAKQWVKNLKEFASQTNFMKT